MLDSSSKEMAGSIKGNIVDLGMYDECIDAKSKEILESRHCMYTMEPVYSSTKFPILPKMSICVPISCGPKDIINIVNGVINASKDIKSLNVTIRTANCSGMRPKFISDTVATVFL